MVCDEIVPGNVSKEIARVELIVNSNSIFPFSSGSISSTSFASPSIENNWYFFGFRIDSFRRTISWKAWCGISWHLMGSSYRLWSHKMQKPRILRAPLVMFLVHRKCNIFHLWKSKGDYIWMCSRKMETFISTRDSLSPWSEGISTNDCIFFLFFCNTQKWQEHMI